MCLHNHYSKVGLLMVGQWKCNVNSLEAVSKYGNMMKAILKFAFICYIRGFTLQNDSRSSSVKIRIICLKCQLTI